MNNFERQPVPEPIEADIRAAMEAIASEFGEKFEEGSEESTDQMITRLRQEGWELVEVITSAHKVAAEHNPDEDMKKYCYGNEVLYL